MFSVQNQINPMEEIRSFMPIMSFCNFPLKSCLFQTLGSSGCNLLFTKALVWVSELWQIGSTPTSLLCHLCYLLLYSISAFSGWAPLHMLPNVCKTITFPSTVFRMLEIFTLQYLPHKFLPFVSSQQLALQGGF